MRGPDLDELRPVAGPLLLCGTHGPDEQNVASYLNRRVRVGGKIERPRCRTLLPKVLARDDEPLAVLEVHDRCGARPPAAPSNGCQQQGRRHRGALWSHDRQAPGGGPIQDSVGGCELAAEGGEPALMGETSDRTPEAAGRCV